MTSHQMSNASSCSSDQAATSSSHNDNANQQLHQHHPPGIDNQLVTSVQGVPLPQTPEDPSLLHAHLASGVHAGAQSHVTTSTFVLNQSAGSGEHCSSGGSNGEIQSQEASSTGDSSSDSKSGKRNNHGKTAAFCIFCFIQSRSKFRNSI